MPADVGRRLRTTSACWAHLADHQRHALARPGGRHANALRSFCRWLAAEGALPAAPAQLTRELLERYLARVHARELSTGQKGWLLGLAEVPG